MYEEEANLAQTFARSTRLDRNKRDKAKRRQAAKPKHHNTRRDRAHKLFNDIEV